MRHYELYLSTKGHLVGLQTSTFWVISILVHPDTYAAREELC